MGVLVITVGTQGDYERKRNETSQQSRFVGAFSGFAQAIRFCGRAGGAHNVLCLLLPILADSDLERKTLTEPGSLTVLGKGGDVGEYLRSALNGRDESKTAIIVPFCKCAVYAHKYSSLALLILELRVIVLFNYIAFIMAVVIIIVSENNTLIPTVTLVIVDQLVSIFEIEQGRPID